MSTDRAAASARLQAACDALKSARQLGTTAPRRARLGSALPAANGDLDADYLHSLGTALSGLEAGSLSACCSASLASQTAQATRSISWLAE